MEGSLHIWYISRKKGGECMEEITLFKGCDNCPDCNDCPNSHSEISYLCDNYKDNTIHQN